jgi:predicted outer membrane protein
MHRRDVLVSMLSATAALAVTRTAVAQPTPAGAMPTPVYLAMATKGGLFLENTARDAFAKTGNPRVKRFARAEVTEQVNLANKIDAVTGGGMPVGAGGPPGPGGVVGGLVAAPFAIAGGVAGAAVGTVDGVLGAGGGGTPGGMTSDEQKAQILAQLSGMQGGPQYDAAFVNASLQGHREALMIHGSYAQSGEDPALRRVARGAIPLINLHISQLSQMQRMMGAAAEG